MALPRTMSSSCFAVAMLASNSMSYRPCRNPARRLASPCFSSAASYDLLLAYSLWISATGRAHRRRPSGVVRRESSTGNEIWLRCHVIWMRRGGVPMVLLKVWAA